MCYEWSVLIQAELAKRLAASPHGESFCIHLACIEDRKRGSRECETQWSIIEQGESNRSKRIASFLRYAWSFAMQDDVFDALRKSNNDHTLRWISSNENDDDRALQFLKLKRAIKTKLPDFHGLVSFFGLPPALASSGNTGQIWALLNQGGLFSQTNTSRMRQYLENIHFDQEVLNMFRSYEGEAAPPSRAAAEPMEIEQEDSPFASAISQSKGAAAMTVNTLLHDDKLAHFRKAICISMDETEGWYALLRMRGLLGGQKMEAEVFRLRTAWENNRSGEPTMSVLKQLFRHDAEFAQLGLTQFCNVLTSLNIPAVQAEVIKLTSWLQDKTSKAQTASETAFSATSDLRGWLLSNRICTTNDVDALITSLRKAGVTSTDSIRGFDKDDLKECGFNTVQAIQTIKALSK